MNITKPLLLIKMYKRKLLYLARNYYIFIKIFVRILFLNCNLHIFKSPTEKFTGSITNLDYVLKIKKMYVYILFYICLYGYDFLLLSFIIFLYLKE